jgi:hypothetical protein
MGLVPPVLLAASSASRSEIVPSGPGLASSACTLDVSPSTLSLAFVTVTRMAGSGRGGCVALGRGVGVGLSIDARLRLSFVLASVTGAGCATIAAAQKNSTAIVAHITLGLVLILIQFVRSIVIAMS